MGVKAMDRYGFWGQILSSSFKAQAIKSLCFLRFNKGEISYY